MDYLKNEAVRPFTIIYNDILDDENLSLHEVAVYIALKVKEKKDKELSKAVTYYHEVGYPKEAVRPGF